MFADKGDRIPDHLARLRDAPWPEFIKAAIAEAHQRYGVQDVAATKLVEPYAIIHGGLNVNGVPDLSRVWWSMLLHYYTWEAAALAGDRQRSKRLQKEAVKRHGCQHWHYPVYDPEGENPIGASWRWELGRPPID